MQLIPVKQKAHVTPSLTIRSYFHPTEEVYYGLPVSVNPDGTYKWKKIRIEGAATYDLNDLRQAIEWHVITNHFAIEGSPLQRLTNTTPMFRILDLEIDAEKAIRRNQMRNAVNSAVEKMNPMEKRDFLRIFDQESVESYSENIIEKRIIELMETNVQRLYDTIVKEQSMVVKQIMARATSFGVITNSIDEGFRTDTGHKLGLTLNAVVHKLESDPKLLAYIDQKSKEAEQEFRKVKGMDANTKVVKKTAAEPVEAKKTGRGAQKQNAAPATQVVASPASTDDDDNDQGDGNQGGVNTEIERTTSPGEGFDPKLFT